MTSVELASTSAEREAVFRLRHDVYVGECGYPFASAEPRLTDPLDATATIFLLKVHGCLMGTVRVNSIQGLPSPQAAEERYRLSSFGEHPPEKVFLGSRAILLPSARGGRLFRYLFREIFRWGLANEVQLTIIDSSPALVPLYLRLGWVRYADNFQDAALGERVPMVLHLNDHRHLRKIASPFCTILDEVTPPSATI